MLKIVAEIYTLFLSLILGLISKTITSILSKECDIILKMSLDIYTKYLRPKVFSSKLMTQHIY